MATAAAICTARPAPSSSPNRIEILANRDAFAAFLADFLADYRSISDLPASELQHAKAARARRFVNALWMTARRGAPKTSYSFGVDIAETMTAALDARAADLAELAAEDAA